MRSTLRASYGIPEALVNVSDIDFAALQARFAKGHNRTEAEKLKRLIAGKLATMVAGNASRMDLAERFQALIDKYNAGSQNIEAFFDELKKFAQSLNEEDQRGIAEGLTEDELALFDILTKPEPVLTKAEEAEVKKVCRELLGRQSGKSWCSLMVASSTISTTPST